MQISLKTNRFNDVKMGVQDPPSLNNIFEMAYLRVSPQIRAPSKHVGSVRPCSTFCDIEFEYEKLLLYKMRSKAPKIINRDEVLFPNCTPNHEATSRRDIRAYLGIQFLEFQEQHYKCE